MRRRLKVAVDQLRERLQARGDGPKRGCLAALVALARGSDLRAPGVVVLGEVATKKLIAGVVLLALLLLIGGVVW